MVSDRYGEEEPIDIIYKIYYIFRDRYTGELDD
jgi:hypothetical protein